MNFGALWQNANPDAAGGGENEPPEDGRYQVALIEAGAAISKKEKPYQKMVWRRLDDKHEWTVIHGFNTEGSANMAKREARAVGVNVDEVTSLEELDAGLKAQVGGYYLVDVQRSGDFTNTYVAGLLTPEIPVDAPEPVTVGGGLDRGNSADDVPFLSRVVEWGDRYHGWNHF